jgi:hypothetical protein
MTQPDSDVDGVGDACDCNDQICTEGNDVNDNPICDPADPACGSDQTSPAVRFSLDGTTCGKEFIGTVNVNIDACDDGTSCWDIIRRSAIKNNNGLLSAIKNAFIGKTYAASLLCPNGVTAPHPAMLNDTLNGCVPMTCDGEAITRYQLN